MKKRFLSLAIIPILCGCSLDIGYTKVSREYFLIKAMGIKKVEYRNVVSKCVFQTKYYLDKKLIYETCSKNTYYSFQTMTAFPENLSDLDISVLGNDNYTFYIGPKFKICLDWSPDVVEPDGYYRINYEIVRKIVYNKDGSMNSVTHIEKAEYTPLSDDVVFSYDSYEVHETATYEWHK